MKKSKVGVMLSLTAMLNSTVVLPGVAADAAVSKTTLIAQSVPDAVTGKTATDASGTTGSSSKVDTEHWPWMEQETPKKRWDGLKSEMPIPSSTTSAPSTKMEKPVSDKMTTIPPPEPLKPAAGLTPERAVPAPEQGRVTTTASTATQSKQPFRLYGRIEQIERGGAPSFPIVLKAQTAKLDTRGQRPMQGNATEFSGKVVASFPANYSGTWGGQLQVQQMQADPRYYQVDPEEARRTMQALRIGMVGNTNFQFENLGSKKVSLAPASVMFMVPSKDTMAGDQMKQMLGQYGMGSGAFGGMIGQMVQGMNIPVVLSYGNAQTSQGVAEGVSGNQFSAHVLKNDIRELAPGVLEQQIVTSKRTINSKTGQARNGFDETVLRFTQRNSQQMYVQAASVDYDAYKHFLMKSVLAGWITKGQVTNTNPMAGMPGMMPGGAAGMGDLQKLLGPGAGQSGQMPQVPGLDPNILKGLFGQ